MKESKKSSSSSKDDMFRCFRQLCAKIADENSYLGKTQLVADLLAKGTAGGKVEKFYFLIQITLTFLFFFFFFFNFKK